MTGATTHLDTFRQNTRRTETEIIKGVIVMIFYIVLLFYCKLSSYFSKKFIEWNGMADCRGLKLYV